MPRSHVAAVVVCLLGAAAAANPSIEVSANFDWHTNSEETPAWVNCSIQVVDLQNPYLVAAARALAPGRIRIGGSEGDKIIYDVQGTECAAAGVEAAFCLNMTRWHQIADFCSHTGTGLVFGLNSMTGRAGKDQPLNFTNHEEFLRYTAANHIDVYGFELGNENSGEVEAVTLAKDYITLRGLINKYWPDASHRPKLIGCDDNPAGSYMQSFLSVAGSVMDVVTYHNYVEEGTNPSLAKDIVTTEFLDAGPKRAAPVIAAWKQHAAQAEIWVGEIAAAWHSGRDNVTNTFESSIWYADALAALAGLNHTGFQRQTMRGGYYGLLDRVTYRPNPDMYTGLLFKTVMGVDMLHAAVTQGGSGVQDSVRAYASCANGVVTVLFINILPTTTVEVHVVLASGLHHMVPRSEYILNSTSLASKDMMLNGVVLAPGDDGSLPDMQPNKVTEEAPLLLPPYGIAIVSFEAVPCSV